MPLLSDRAPSDIPQLLQRGLDYFGRNRCEDAIECWKEVCRRQPGHPEALDYLEAAGFDITSLPDTLDTAEPVAESDVMADSPSQEPRLPSDVVDIRTRQPDSEATDPITGATPTPLEELECQDADTLDCEEIRVLISQRRYEEVLDILYAARARAPRDASLSRSIRHVRERLANEYACRLVDLDRVPSLAHGMHWSALVDADWSDANSTVAREARQLAALVDGISSFADIVAASPLGQLSTLRGLCALLDRGHLDVGAANEALPARTTTPATPSMPAGRDKLPDPASVKHVARVAPASGIAPPLTDSTAPDDGYAGLFKSATEAYLLRDYDRAIELFSECRRRRPDDRRARHNLEALMRRVRKA